MKFQILLCLGLSAIVFKLSGQSIGINSNGNDPDPSAILDITSTDKGLLIPRMTFIEKRNISDPATGLMVFQTDSIPGYYYFNGEHWSMIGGNSGGMDDVIVTGSQDTSSIVEYMIGDTSYITDSSGILYDTGGPLGNYGNNEAHSIIIVSSVFAIGLNIHIIEFDTESPYDSLVIETYTETGSDRHVLSGHLAPMTLPLIPGAYAAILNFKSNAVNTNAGFKIRWDFLYPPEPADESIIPIAGWYFDQSKVAMRGGINVNNVWDSDSIGMLSFGWGGRAKAIGERSIAIGNDALAEGFSSLCIGQGISSGAYSIAIGEDNNASEQYSVAIGRECTASQRSVAIGSQSTAGPHGSIALGENANALGNWSTALGKNTYARSEGSVAIGYNCDSRAHWSYAFGRETLAKANGSTVFGTWNQCNTSGGFVIGIWNDTVVSVLDGNSATAPVFMIGNGINNNARSNAMVVRRDGNVGIGNSAPAQLLHVGSSQGAAMRIGTFETLSDAGGSILSLNAAFIPAVDNSYDLGLSNYRWDDIWATNGVIQTSDVRDKENIIEIEYGLEKVMQLRPVTYQWKEGPDRSFQLGLIAQEVQEVLPGVVRSTNFVHDEEGNITEVPTERLGMNYAALTPVIIKAMQELQAVNLQLVNDVSVLKEENAAMRAMIEEHVAALEKVIQD